MQKKNPTTATIDLVEERLLSAAVKVFLEKGFAAASIDEIAARAKASKLTFYNRYGSKQGLFEAVVNRKNAALLDMLSKIISVDMPVEVFLQTVADRFYTAFFKQETIALIRVLHAEADRFPKLADVFDKAGPSRAAEMLAAEFEKQMNLGILRRADARLAAEHFLHLSLGELTRRTLLGLRPRLSKAEISKRIATGIDVFLRAYANG